MGSEFGHWVLVGVIVGVIAGMMTTQEGGLIANVILAVFGATLGGYGVDFVYAGFELNPLAPWLTATGGAVLLVVLLRLFRQAT